MKTETCPLCLGSKIFDGNPCDECHGSGVIDYLDRLDHACLWAVDHGLAVLALVAPLAAGLIYLIFWRG